MPQGILPFFPGGVEQISEALAFKKEGGKIVYFNYQMPVFIHDECDIKTFRMITSQFCVNGNAKQAEIVRAFGVPPISVKRGVKTYREHGPQGFYTIPKPRGPSKITPKITLRIQKMLDEFKTVEDIAAELSLKANTITKAISLGKIFRPIKKKNKKE